MCSDHGCELGYRRCRVHRVDAARDPVIATGRSQAKLERTHARMLDAAPKGCTVPEPIQADLSSFAGVQRLAKDVSTGAPA